MPTSMRPAESKGDLIIIGGGASGLAAACVAMRRGLRVLVLEKRDRVGKKLLATGNGRCNLMNMGEPVYFGHPRFAGEVLRHCPREQVLAFFEGLGLTTVADGDLLYPASLQAASVLDVLRLPLEESPLVQLVTSAEVTDIRREHHGLQVHCANGQRFAAAAVIAAAGGPAQPRLSGADSLVAPLQALGHRLIPTRPALTGLITDKAAVRGLKGLRLPARCTLADGAGMPVAATEGEVIFAEDGVSGVCIMQLSRDAGDMLAQGKKPVLSLDFSPLLGLMPRRMRRVPQAELTMPGESRAAVMEWLHQRTIQLPPERLLTGAAPRLLADRLRGLSLADTAARLADFSLDITGLRGFDHAQVAAGGIDPSDVNPATMASRLVPGLFLTGELLDVDGDCGGHNLLFAWASGLLAGKGVGGVTSDK